MKLIKMTRKKIIKYILAAQNVLDEQVVPKRGCRVTYWDGEKVVIRKI